MKYRLITAILCSSLSFLAIGVSLKIAFPFFIAAWILYFLILFYWVRDNRAPKALVVIGTVVGVLSVVFSAFIAIFWAFPAIALMLHVAKCSFWPKTPYKSINYAPLAPDS
ncbi:hypothetical protein [Microbulbifer sp. TRSA007]|uniref:hypothetical protein n=1 Tax=Microbulbifer sp. TRSA007 TaxID=3243384 RepID=UPI004039B46C